MPNSARGVTPMGFMTDGQPIITEEYLSHILTVPVEDSSPRVQPPPQSSKGSGQSSSAWGFVSRFANSIGSLISPGKDAKKAADSNRSRRYGDGLHPGRRLAFSPAKYGPAQSGAEQATPVRNPPSVSGSNNYQKRSDILARESTWQPNIIRKAMSGSLESGSFSDSQHSLNSLSSGEMRRHSDSEGKIRQPNAKHGTHRPPHAAVGRGSSSVSITPHSHSATVPVSSIAMSSATRRVHEKILYLEDLRRRCDHRRGDFFGTANDVQPAINAIERNLRMLQLVEHATKTLGAHAAPRFPTDRQQHLQNVTHATPDGSTALSASLILVRPDLRARHSPSGTVRDQDGELLHEAIGTRVEEPRNPNQPRVSLGLGQMTYQHDLEHALPARPLATGYSVSERPDSARSGSSLSSESVRSALSSVGGSVRSILSASSARRSASVDPAPSRAQYPSPIISEPERDAEPSVPTFPPSLVASQTPSVSSAPPPPSSGQPPGDAETVFFAAKAVGVDSAEGQLRMRGLELDRQMWPEDTMPQQIQAEDAAPPAAGLQLDLLQLDGLLTDEDLPPSISPTSDRHVSPTMNGHVSPPIHGHVSAPADAESPESLGLQPSARNGEYSPVPQSQIEVKADGRADFDAAGSGAVAVPDSMAEEPAAKLDRGDKKPAAPIETGSNRQAERPDTQMPAESQHALILDAAVDRPPQPSPHSEFAPHVDPPPASPEQHPTASGLQEPSTHHAEVVHEQEQTAYTLEPSPLPSASLTLPAEEASHSPFSTPRKPYQQPSNSASSYASPHNTKKPPVVPRGGSEVVSRSTSALATPTRVKADDEDRRRPTPSRESPAERARVSAEQDKEHEGLARKLGMKHRAVTLTRMPRVGMGGTKADGAVGIGISFAQTRNGFIVVTGVHGTAAREEMFPSDVILTVNGVEVKDMHIDSVVGLIKGEPGTRVQLKVLSDLTADAPHHNTPIGKGEAGRQPHQFRDHRNRDSDASVRDQEAPMGDVRSPDSSSGAIRVDNLGNKTQAQWARDKLGLDSAPISRVPSVGSQGD